METLQAIKSRIRAVRNIGQITKAMEVVSATKMRRAQEIALASRPYAIAALALLGKILPRTPIETPLTKSRAVRTTLVILVTSDRGLAGAFNSQVLRLFERLLADDPYRERQGHRFLIATVGKKAAAYVDKRGYEVVGRFHGFGDYAEVEEVRPLADLVVSGFAAGRWDRVLTISTHFRTTLKQEVLIRQILPADIEKIRETVRELRPERGRYAGLSQLQAASDQLPATTEYLFEPSPAEVLASLIPHLITMQIYHLILEANASEHSARMVAMKNASDNAAEVSGELTIAFNKARQAAITKELVEITATRAALEA